MFKPIKCSCTNLQITVFWLQPSSLVVFDLDILSQSIHPHFPSQGKPKLVQSLGLLELRQCFLPWEFYPWNKILQSWTWPLLNLEKQVEREIQLNCVEFRRATATKAKRLDGIALCCNWCDWSMFLAPNLKCEINVNVNIWNTATSNIMIMASKRSLKRYLTCESSELPKRTKYRWLSKDKEVKRVQI